MRVPSVRKLSFFAFALALAGAVALAGGLSAARAQEGFKQIKLTEAQVQGYIAAQKDMAALAEKLGDSEKPDPALLGALDETAKKHGFADFGEYDTVAANISLVAGGIDPAKKTFTEPAEMIKQEMAAVKADKSLSKAQKAEALKSLEEGAQAAEPIQFRENIALVTKYFDKLDFGPSGEDSGDEGGTGGDNE